MNNKIVFILLWLCLSLYADTLKDSYVFDKNSIYSTDLIDNPTVNFKVLEIPDGSFVYRVYSSIIVEEFKKKGIEVSPPNSPTVTFFRQVNYDENLIKQKIADELLEKYRNYDIKIEQITLKPASNTDLKGFEIVSIDTSPIANRRDSGTIKVEFGNKLGHKRSIFFSYHIKAKIKAFVTTQDISANERVMPKLYREEMVDFGEVSRGPATIEDLQNVYTKGYIKKDRILLKNLLKSLPDIMRGDRVVLSDKKEGFFIQSFGEAIDKGSIGEVIRVRLQNGKIVNAKITGKNSVEIK